MGNLQGKSVIVTGASTGMGRAIAIALAEEGARLAIVARNEERLNETAEAVRQKGAEVLVFPADVGNYEKVRSIVQQVVEHYGKIDVLVNNAGTNTKHRNLADISVADWNLVINTNLTGPFLFTREALPYMRTAKNGLIINVSSGAGLRAGAPGGVAYSASKRGLHSLTESTNLEERRHGIRACVVVPGEVDTPNLDLRPLPPSAEARARMLKAEDIANAVVYVANQPDYVAVEMVVVSPTELRNYNADYERYVQEGHTAQRQD